MNSKLRNKNTIRWLVAIPFAASIISMIHIVSFFELGNPNWMSIALAITFEIAALASLISFTILDVLKGTRWSLYFIFVILFFMQMVGNVYYSFDYVTIKLIETGNWMVVFKEFLDTTVNLFTDELPNPSYTKYILSCAIGMPIPLISLSFIHILVKYLDKTDSDTKSEEVETEGDTKSEEVETEGNTKSEVNTEAEEPKVEKVEEPKVEKVEEPTEEPKVEETKGIKVEKFPKKKKEEEEKKEETELEEEEKKEETELEERNPKDQPNKDGKGVIVEY